MAYRAVDSAGRQVVLRFLPADPGIVAIFRRDMALARRVRHPNLLPIYDFSVKGRPYLVTPLIDGVDLGSLLADGPLAPELAVGIVSQVAAALDALHRGKLVLRNVKPANILVEEGPRGPHVWLIDWSLAWQGAPEVLAGTADYLAPELLTGAAADGRADVYSLAMVLYELLAGHRPFLGDVVRPALAGPSPSPPALGDVVRQGLEWDPDRRYSSAGDLASAARAALDGMRDEVNAIGTRRKRRWSSLWAGFAAALVPWPSSIQATSASPAAERIGERLWFAYHDLGPPEPASSEDVQ